MLTIILSALTNQIFINDLPLNFKESIIKLFADDTTIVANGCDLNETLKQLKVDIKILNEWCKHNRLY